MGEFPFLIINNKKTISLISLKRYSITLHIRAHLSVDLGGRGFKALGGVAFSIFCHFQCKSMGNWSIFNNSFIKKL